MWSFTVFTRFRQLLDALEIRREWKKYSPKPIRLCRTREKGKERWDSKHERNRRKKGQRRSEMTILVYLQEKFRYWRCILALFLLGCETRVLPTRPLQQGTQTGSDGVEEISTWCCASVRGRLSINHTQFMTKHNLNIKQSTGVKFTYEMLLLNYFDWHCHYGKSTIISTKPDELQKYCENNIVWQLNS